MDSIVVSVDALESVNRQLRDMLINLDQVLSRVQGTIGHGVKVAEILSQRRRVRGADIMQLSAAFGVLEEDLRKARKGLAQLCVTPLVNLEAAQQIIEQTENQTAH